MSIIVQKFGGTSVANPERIQAAANIAIKTFNQGHQVVIVVSAMSGETNKLIKLCEEMMPSPELREYDSIVSTSEQVTSGLMSLSLINLGFKAKSYSGHQVKIETDNAHSKARIINIEDTNLKKDLKNGFIAVVAGFQGVDKEGNITTLGRGGSDTTAVALAAALKAEECQIYTDVDGIYTTDPRVVPEAKKIKSINFEEMLEMASLGSKVLQTRSVEFAGKYKVKLRVLSSFSPNNEGTEINFEEKKNMEDLKKAQKKMGWDLLLNESRFIERQGQRIAILGVENWGSGGFKKAGDLNKALSNVAAEDFKILMSHDPSHWEAEVIPHPFNIHLTLSGHTHGMQFGIEIPGWIKWSPIKWRYKQWAGIYEKLNQRLNVNRGFGYLAYPGRVGIWPEVTVITLNRSKTSI